MWLAGGVRYNEFESENWKTIQYETPVGNLTQQLRRTNEAGQTWFRVEHLIKTVEDLRTYQYLWECMTPRPAYHITSDSIEDLGEDGLVMGLTPCTPILHLIMYDLGLERTLYFLDDYAKSMHQLMSVMSEKVLAATRLAAGSPLEVGIIPENSGTMLISPKQFGRHCKPLLSEMARIFHKNDKLLLLHACGHLHDLLPQIAETGLDGIESLTPPPTGNVTLSYARKILGPDKTIIGGMDPVWFQQATPREIEEKIEAIANEVKPGRHFMLMPSDSTPADVPLANFEAVRRSINRVAQWNP
jgi:uroporphyrinogen-III decarboxylase